MNPARNELKRAKLNMVLSGCGDGKRVLMIDMDACEVNAVKLDECFEAGLEAVGRITAAIEKIVSEAGKIKREVGSFYIFLVIFLKLYWYKGNLLWV